MKLNVLFWIILVCGLLGGAALGVRWQMEEARNIQPEFRSLAKVVVIWESRGEDGTAPHDADLYGTCMEILESAEMKCRALDRVCALNKDLSDQAVEIRTARTPGSGIINILATGAEAKYIRVFLDALADEFIAFRKNLRLKEQGRVLQHHLEEVVRLQNAMEQAASVLVRARAAAPPTQGPAEIARLIARLIQLRDQRDNLRTTIRQEATPEVRTHAEQELKAVEHDISDHEDKIKLFSAALQELRSSEEFSSTAKARYEKEFTEVEALQKQYETEADLVAIHQYATPASMNIRSPSAQIIIGGGIVGAVLGGGVGFIAGLIASWRPAKSVSPES